GRGWRWCGHSIHTVADFARRRALRSWIASPGRVSSAGAGSKTQEEAMRRSAKWYTDEAAKQERELQRIVWPNGAPRRSAARALYPNHPSSGRDPAQPQQATKPAASSIAARVYPHLKRS